MAKLPPGVGGSAAFSALSRNAVWNPNGGFHRGVKSEVEQVQLGLTRVCLKNLCVGSFFSVSEKPDGQKKVVGKSNKSHGFFWEAGVL